MNMDNQNRAAFIFVVLILAGLGAYLLFRSDTGTNNQYPEVMEKNLGAEERSKLEDAVEKADRSLVEAEEDYYEDRYQALVNKGAALLSLGRLKEAQDALEQAVPLVEGNSTAHTGLFRVMLERGNLDGAEAEIKLSLRVRENNPNVWPVYIDFMKDKRGANNEALEALYQEALTKTKEHIILVTKYAHFLEDISNLQKAKEIWVKAGQIDEGNKPAYDAEIARIDAKINTPQ
jgi:tetratricopeptide (TPR) repeat protein